MATAAMTLATPTGPTDIREVLGLHTRLARGLTGAVVLAMAMVMVGFGVIPVSIAFFGAAAMPMSGLIADQIGRRVIQVDERRGTLSVWEHVREDDRLDVSEGPDRVYSLDDLREVIGAQGGGPERGARPRPPAQSRAVTVRLTP